MVRTFRQQSVWKNAQSLSRQSISKEIRGKSNIDHLAEEMADVCICIEALKQIYGISDEQMQFWIDFKQKRIEDRMLKGE